MATQQAFFTSDTAQLRQSRGIKDESIGAREQTDSPRKTLAERLIAAWLAPWTHGFTPLW
jgi:hypothetical protein